MMGKWRGMESGEEGEMITLWTALIYCRLGWERDSEREPNAQDTKKPCTQAGQQLALHRRV